MTSTPCAASDRATARPVMWQLKTTALGLRRAGAEREATAPSRSDAVKGAVDVGEDVLGLLDADRKAQEAVADPQPPALLGGEPAVRGDRRVEHLGGEIADRRRPRRELESVEKAKSGPAGVIAKLERHHAPGKNPALARRPRRLPVIPEARG